MAESLPRAASSLELTQLCSAVAAEQGLLRDFIGLLNAEQEILTGADTQRLASLAEDKTQLAVRLNQQASLRARLLVQLTGSAERPAVEAWLAQQASQDAASDATRLRGQWQDLMQQATEARALNETNGRLITLHMQHNQQVLNALMAAGNQAALYGPDGQTQAPGALRTGRSLGEA